MNRADFIARVRDAVAAGAAGCPDPIPAAVQPPLGPDLWAVFCSRAGELQATVIKGPARPALAELAQREGWRSAIADESLALPPGVTHLASGSAAALAGCDVAITHCDALIAQTGSVLISSRSAGGRVPAALAPHHVVLAASEQLVGTLAEAYQRLLAAGPWPSMVCVVSGPSRTGDIERTIVLGAHGPEKLTIIVE